MEREFDLAIKDAFAMWNRGWLLDDESITFHTQHGNVVIKSTDKVLTATFKKKKVVVR